MASIRSLDEREDSMMEGQRMSLLDVVEEKNRSMNKVSKTFDCHIHIRVKHYAVKQCMPH